MKPSDNARKEHQAFLLLRKRGYVSRKDSGDDVCDTRPRTEQSRALADDVARFLNNGGTIQQVEPGVGCNPSRY